MEGPVAELESVLFDLDEVDLDRIDLRPGSALALSLQAVLDEGDRTDDCYASFQSAL